MKYQFKQAVKIGSRFYSLGFHMVPPEHLENNFFKKLVKAGLVVEPSVAAKPKLEVDMDSLPQHVREHAERILKANQKKAAASEAKSAEKEDESPPKVEKGEPEGESPPVLNETPPSEDEDKKQTSKKKK